MAYRTWGSSTGFYQTRSIGDAVRWLLIINTAVFLLYFTASLLGVDGPFRWLELRPFMVVENLAVWQLLTYSFLHSPSDPFHILFNMLALWMFGRTLESTWGSRRFLEYYLLCAVGAGVVITLVSLLTGATGVSTIGASGAIFGLLLAFGYLFPEQELLFFFLFPIKAKYFVMIVGAIALLMSIRGTNTGISHLAHLGGMIVGFAYLKMTAGRARPPYRAAVRKPSLARQWQDRYRQWKLQRAKRKFQVYLKKHGRENDHYMQ